MAAEIGQKKLALSGIWLSEARIDQTRASQGAEAAAVTDHGAPIQLECRVLKASVKPCRQGTREPVVHRPVPGVAEIEPERTRVNLVGLERAVVPNPRRIEIASQHIDVDGCTYALQIASLGLRARGEQEHPRLSFRGRDDLLNRVEPVFLVS